MRGKNHLLVNRSWRNRAGVEHVMAFRSKDEHEEFMQSVPTFEEMLVNSGNKLLKYYRDFNKGEQTRRPAARKRDPLKQPKSSPVDAVAQALEGVLGGARRDAAAHAHASAAMAHRSHAGVYCCQSAGSLKR